MKLVYFVHDLTDPAVCRRVRMLRQGFETIILVGFRRSDRLVAEVDGLRPIDLGKTESARLFKRAGSVAAAMLAVSLHAGAFQGASFVLARNLEMLAIAALARRRFMPTAALTYECLDIHRIMVQGGGVGTAMRYLERRLLGMCDHLVVSSPGFLSGYFKPIHGDLPRTFVLENKVLATELLSPIPSPSLPAGPPWRIGWFGQLRCARSLHFLAHLAAHSGGLVQVVLRGQPAFTAIPEVMNVVGSAPGMEFLGPYDRSIDLPAMYADVHFTWAIDFFGNYGNSEWLLPNRLYEGSLYGAVPIALSRVETGRWLARHAVGVLLDEPIEENMIRFFETLDAGHFAAMRAAVARIPRSAVVADDAECQRLCATVANLPAPTDLGMPARAQEALDSV